MHTYMLCFHLIVRETNISAFYQTTAPSTLFKHTLSSTISFIKDIGNYKERHPWYECVIVAQVPLFPTRLCNMPDSVRTSPVPGIYCAKLLTIADEFIRIPWLSALVQAFLLLTRAECSSDLSISCMIDVTRFAREIEHCFVDPNVGKRSNRIHHDSDRLTTSPPWSHLFKTSNSENSFVFDPSFMPSSTFCILIPYTAILLLSHPIIAPIYTYNDTCWLFFVPMKGSTWKLVLFKDIQWWSTSWGQGDCKGCSTSEQHQYTSTTSSC